MARYTQRNKMTGNKIRHIWLKKWTLLGPQVPEKNRGVWNHADALFYKRRWLSGEQASQILKKMKSGISPLHPFCLGILHVVVHKKKKIKISMVFHTITAFFFLPRICWGMKEHVPSEDEQGIINTQGSGFYNKMYHVKASYCVGRNHDLHVDF